MPLLRRSSLNQLKRIDSEINKKDTEDKKVSNLMWAHNLIKADKKGVRKIATFDELFKTDIPDSPTKVEFKNEKVYFYKDNKWFSSSNSISDVKDHKKRFGDDVEFSVDGYAGRFKTIDDFNAAKNADSTIFTSKSVQDLEKERKEAKERVANKRKLNYMKNEILSFEKMFENGPNDTSQEIMKNMKTIQNWFTEPEYDSKREMKINLIGKPVKTDKINGYINRIEGEYIFIESIIEPFGIIKMKMKEFVKMFKPVKDSNTIMSFSIYGPNDKTDSSAPKEGDSNAPKIDSKGQKVKDQKISDKNNIVKSIKENNVIKFAVFENMTEDEMEKEKKISVKTANYKVLKYMATEYPEFESIDLKLFPVRRVEDLRAKMLQILAWK